MISDFKENYPDYSFNEDHLKQRVKSTLKDLNTGTSNKAEGDKAALQSDEFLKKVQETKTFAQRNVLKRGLLSSNRSLKRLRTLLSSQNLIPNRTKFWMNPRMTVNQTRCCFFSRSPICPRDEYRFQTSNEVYRQSIRN